MGAGFRRPRHQRRTRRFTLIEMLVTVGLLAIVMLMLFRFFANMQGAYNRTLKSTVLADEARLAFDSFSQDLQSIVCREDDLPGKHFEFHQPLSTMLWFVCATDPPPGAASGMVEVGYRLRDFQLQRAFVDDTNEHWNVYGHRDDADDQDGYQPVVDGVIALRFTCYDSNLAAYRPDNATRMPAFVGLEMTLLDRKSFELWRVLPTDKRAALVQQSARTFRRVVCLSPTE